MGFRLGSIPSRNPPQIERTGRWMDQYSIAAVWAAVAEEGTTATIAGWAWEAVDEVATMVGLEVQH